MKNIECNKVLVELAVVLHDVDDYKVTGNKSDDLVNCKKYLNTQDLTEEEKELVCDIIKNVSFSKNKDKIQNLSIEAKIVQDADRIDAIGAVGIARAFQFGGKNNRNMYGKNSTLNHFDEKLLKIYDMLNLEESKKIAKERHEFLVEFYNQFKNEIGEAK